MNHDVATCGVPAGASPTSVRGVRIRDVESEVVLAVKIAAVDDVQPFGGSIIALTLFGSGGLTAECNGVGFQWPVGAIERQCSRGLVHDNSIGLGPIGRVVPAGSSGRGRDDEQGCDQKSVHVRMRSIASRQSTIIALGRSGRHSLPQANCLLFEER